MSVDRAPDEGWQKLDDVQPEFDSTVELFHDNFGGIVTGDLAYPWLIVRHSTKAGDYDVYHVEVEFQPHGLLWRPLEARQERDEIIFAEPRK